MGKTYSGSSKVKKAFYGSTSVKAIYYGSTKIYPMYEAYTLTFSAATQNITVTCSRTSSPSANAATGTLATGATVYTDDVLQFTVTSSNSHYVLEASTRDSTTYTETVTVTGNVSKQYHAVKKSSYLFKVNSSSYSIGGTYPYSGSINIANLVAVGQNQTHPYKPYIAILLGGSASAYSTSTTLYLSGQATSANQQQRVTVYYYTYAAAPITIVKPRLSVDNYGNRMRVRIFNDNSFAVNAEYTYYYDDSSGESNDGGNLISNIYGNSYYDLNIYTSSGAGFDYFEVSVQFSKDGSTSDWEDYYG